MRIVPLLMLMPALAVGAERINHEGRILGPLQSVTTPVQFNTAQADAIVASLQIMPTDSAWNEDISGNALLANSAAMITKIRDDLYDAPNNYATRRRMVVFEEMNYVLVPDSQPLTGIRFVTYPGDSDFNGGTSPVANWPVPSIMPIETWPTGTGSQTLEQWQRASGGDRHAIIVQPGATPRIFETWQARLTNNSPAWQASNGAIFPLDSNTPRPAGWTSGDAAGLPMFPALVRYDECQRGVIEHAMRIVVKRSRQSYIYPASHQAGSTTDADTPAMGQRVRLKAGFVIPASWSAQERAVAVALKKYGAFVADNGNFFSISICPDDRWPDGCWEHFSTGAGSDFLDVNQFEVVQTTGATGGPRAAGKPGADAGGDQNVTLAAGATLAGSVTNGGTALWSSYPPGGAQASQVHFANTNSVTTTVTFDAAGAYTLLLKSSKTGFTPAYDAVVITVVAGGSNPAPTLSDISPTTRVAGGGAFTLTLNGANFLATSTLTWTGQAALSPLTVNATQMTVTVPAGYLASAGTPEVRISNPAPGGGTSSPQTMVITAAPAGGGGSGGGSGGGGGGCGIGGLSALVMFSMGIVLSGRWLCVR